MASPTSVRICSMGLRERAKPPSWLQWLLSSTSTCASCKVGFCCLIVLFSLRSASELMVVSYQHSLSSRLSDKSTTRNIHALTTAGHPLLTDDGFSDALSAAPEGTPLSLCCLCCLCCLCSTWLVGVVLLLTRLLSTDSLLVLEDVDALFALDRKSENKSAMSFSGMLNSLVCWMSHTHTLSLSSHLCRRTAVFPLTDRSSS
jgi:hypothetical protein